MVVGVIAYKQKGSVVLYHRVGETGQGKRIVDERGSTNRDKAASGSKFLRDVDVDGIQQTLGIGGEVDGEGEVGSAAQQKVGLGNRVVANNLGVH